ncbi:MAG TPA: sigma-70 family RNA polymerase sigma factor [Verrucomicrobiae bacterium]|jgi:RNA polymerase sigma-70 factor (ECF subfamily)|nr:sigma-70 family RNA polymerase sigma factor [Verrucomicrobiae bacterium]
MGKLSDLFSITDEQAMWRVQAQDDHAAFARLVQRWELPILRLCERMTGDQGEDLKQETFARAFLKRKEFRGGCKFSTWLWRIALNLCYDELRKRQRRGENCGGPESEDGIDLPESASPELAPDLQVAAREECEVVRCALLRLPLTLQTALGLRYCEGLKVREIAEILEIPETTAGSRIAAGLEQISRILGPQLDAIQERKEHKIRTANDV